MHISNLNERMLIAQYHKQGERDKGAERQVATV